jgi:misacylated tRNA(Ala) deacylase
MSASGQKLLFREDAYLRTSSALVAGVNERGGILLDRTIFYATSGGQPGDTGWLERADGSNIRIAATVTGESKEEVIHIPEPGQTLPETGEMLTLRLDWDRRFNLMRMHSACHILSVVCPFPITGASVGEEESRVDFDLPDAGVTREGITEAMMALIDAAHPVSTRWIDEAELDANPGLVKSKNVRPPRGQGRIRLVLIGEGGSVDSQPCGGTHVANVSEIGPLHISKIEKKGRENRRFRIRFGALTENSA